MPELVTLYPRKTLSKANSISSLNKFSIRSPQDQEYSGRFRDDPKIMLSRELSIYSSKAISVYGGE